MVLIMQMLILIILFLLSNTKLFIPVFTLSAKHNQKLSNVDGAESMSVLRILEKIKETRLKLPEGKVTAL